MSTRDDILDEVRRYAAAHGPADLNDDLDDEILDDEPVTAAAALEPIGEVTLLNGVVYKPRLLCGIEDLAFMRATRARREHVLFYGPPGTGKTVLAQAPFVELATREDATDDTSPWVHQGVETVVCSATTEEADLIGTFVQDPISGNHVWNPGPLHRALIHGIPLYVDEIFLADPRVLSSTLYPVMDGRPYLTITANPSLGPIPIPEGFFVVGSGNPDVPGAVFSEALRDRFDHHIEIGTDWELAAELGVPAEIITVAKNLDLQRLNQDLSWSPQLRSLLSFRDALGAFGLEFALNNLIAKTPAEDRHAMLKAIESSGYKGNNSGALPLGGRSTKTTGAKR